MTLAALAIACRGEEGILYQCDCVFITDFDEDARREIEVCSPSDARAEAIGRGCAQGHAPGPVQACSCKRAPGGGACERGTCRAIAEAP